MKLTVERLPESQVRLDIAAEEPEFAEAVDRAAKKVSRDIAIPGFRKGHVPRHMIERMYGREVFIEEAGRLIMDDLYKQAIEQENLTPVGNPEVNITQLDPIAFTVEVPVYPTVEPGDWQSVRVDPEDAAIDESDVDEVLQRLRKASSPWVDAAEERTPGEGDQISLDLAIFENDEQFQEPIENAQFIIGESQLFDELKDAVLKLKPCESGEAVITFAEDDDAAVEKLRGKTLRYEVTLKGIKERELLEVDDEFAKTYAGEESAEDLIAAIRKDLHQGKTNEARTRVLNSIIDKIAEGAAIEIPAVMIDDAVNEEVARSRQRLQMQRTSLEAYLRSAGQTEDEFKEELRPEVARRLRNSLVLREIAEREGIAVTDEEVEAEIEGIVSGAANPEQMQKVYSADRYMRSVLRNEMYDERLSTHLIDIATEGKGATLNGYVAGEDDAPGRKGVKAKASGKSAKRRGASKNAEEVEAAEAPAGSVAGTGESDCPDGYPIKGNASSMIYHLPGQGSYENTIPEICFATEEDAGNAGYRASKSPGA
ncbi:MAG TPA: trigger factor, partial [Bauldia sp.]|nr:trigger factor [Bauldia sp.]